MHMLHTLCMHHFHFITQKMYQEFIMRKNDSIAGTSIVSIVAMIYYNYCHHKGIYAMTGPKYDISYTSISNNASIL